MARRRRVIARLSIRLMQSVFYTRRISDCKTVYPLFVSRVRPPFRGQPCCSLYRFITISARYLSPRHLTTRRVDSRMGASDRPIFASWRALLGASNGQGEIHDPTAKLHGSQAWLVVGGAVALVLRLFLRHVLAFLCLPVWVSLCSTVSNTDFRHYGTSAKIFSRRPTS